MEDIYIFCDDDPECVCEDKCCQDCEVINCEKRCSIVKYKEKVYGSDEFLIEELFKLADRLDSWLVAVAAEKIRSLIGR